MFPKLTLSISLIILLTACSSGDNDPATGSINGSPVTPINLTTTSENSRIIIKWNAVSNADSYKLSWSETQGQANAGNTELIPTGTEFTHEFLTDKKQRLTTGIPYFYSISAVNSKGSSTASTEVEGRLKNKPWLMPLLDSVMSN